MFSGSSQRPFGSWKQLIEYVGIAWATALIKISFPPIERIFYFQPESLFPTLSTRVIPIFNQIYLFYIISFLYFHLSILTFLIQLLSFYEHVIS